MQRIFNGSWFSLGFWMVVLIVFLFGCQQFQEVGIFTLKAGALSDEVGYLDDVVMQAAAELSEEDQLAVQLTINKIKLIATEARQFESLDDFSKLDLTKMYGTYVKVKGDIEFLKYMIYDPPDFAVYHSIPEYQRQELERFYIEAAALAEDIDAFVADPETNSALQTAARITAFGTVATKILITVGPKIMEAL